MPIKDNTHLIPPGPDIPIDPPPDGGVDTKIPGLVVDDKIDESLYKNGVGGYYATIYKSYTTNVYKSNALIDFNHYSEFREYFHYSNVAQYDSDYVATTLATDYYINGFSLMGQRIYINTTCKNWAPPDPVDPDKVSIKALLIGPGSKSNLTFDEGAWDTRTWGIYAMAYKGNLEHCRFVVSISAPGRSTIVGKSPTSSVDGYYSNNSVRCYYCPNQVKIGSDRNLTNFYQTHYQFYRNGSNLYRNTKGQTTSRQYIISPTSQNPYDTIFPNYLDGLKFIHTSEKPDVSISTTDGSYLGNGFRIEPVTMVQGYKCHRFFPQADSNFNPMTGADGSWKINIKIYKQLGWNSDSEKLVGEATFKGGIAMGGQETFVYSQGTSALYFNNNQYTDCGENHWYGELTTQLFWIR